MYGIQVLSILFSAVAFLPLVLSDTEVNAEDHACGGDLTAPYGTIRSPGVINSYQANLNCTWRITTQTGNKIKFYIKKMELGGSGDCSAGDYVLAEDPVISKSTRFCDSIMDKGRTFESTRNFYSLAFISDNIVNADENGFEISYTTAAIPNCDEDFCDNRGECSGNNTCNCFSPHVGYRCLYEKSNVDHAVYSESVRNLLHYENQDEAVCAVFGMDHIMTFQGSLETFTGNCIYLMARFTLRGEYVEVMLKRNSDCYSLSTSCTDAVIIESQSQELTINRNGAVQLNKESISLPSNPPPYEIQRPTGQIIKVKIESAKITVDLTTFRIMLTVPRSIVNQTKGLCEYNSEDYLSIVDKYIRPGNKDCSPSLVHNQQVCDKENIEVEEKICDLLYTSVFAECRLHIPVDDYYHACVGDTCRCDVTRNADCHCSSVAAYASECSRMHIPVGNWRSESLCSPGCPGNQVFVECSDSCTQPTCRLPNVGTCDLNKPCTEACVCPDDTYWYEEKQVCLPITECPCYHAESTHAPGAVIDDQCNTCTCTGSVWKCTENPCSGLALVSGFGHFTTFDGLMYTYQSVCEYIYAYDCSDYQDFAIYIKTEPCGASNEFTCLKETQIFSYTSLSTSNANEKSVTLVKGGNILVNKKLAIDLPLTTGAISVHRLSSNYIAVDIEHVSVTVIWDGQSMIEVIVPPKLKGQVCGLGGKYDEKSANDLTTRNNLIAKSAFMFSESWIIPHLAQPCPRIPLVKACQQNEELAIKAREVCSIICSSTFSECQEKLNCEKFQANCEEDVCSCSSEMNCECAAVAVFALECATFGKVFIPWRTEEFCPMSCPSTQEYRAGATFCGRTCRSLMETETCSTSLKAEGCSCPDGKYLDKDSETCVAIKDCSCYVDQGWISPGAIYQENSKPCYCINGKIECNKNNQVASEREIICPSYMEKVNCSIGEQETKCLRTCENKGQYCLNSECKPVCVCPGGLVYHKGQCIEETTCPCKIFDIEHEVGTTTKSGCETIVCTEQGWDVIDRTNCYSTCSLVGGAYYQTFDNRRFNFRGTCEYVMATDDCDVQTQGSYEYEFRITAQSRDCPQSNKAMCETEVHVTIGIYKVILAKGVTAEALVAREVTDYGLLDWYLTVHKIGMYTIVDAHRNISTDYRHYKEKNIVVAWDGNTKTYIKFNNYMSPEYNVKTCGLCGDNDGDFHNDFKTSTKNTASSSAECGNSWKVDSRCADVNSTVQVTCGSRRSWAQQKCDILLTDAFAECRDVVEIDYFYETCVTETCSCESGGDCDCFCTAVSAYAYACADAGVIVQWRLPSICPTMCESYNTDPDCVWKYRPCQLCIKTCCTDRCFPGCFEGCYASCPDGTVYDEITNSCIKEEECNKTQCIKELVSPKCPSKMHQMIEYETEWINIPSQLKSINGIEFTLGQIEKYFNTSCEYPANMQCQPPPKTVIQDNVICDAKKGFKCLDYLQADGKFCLDYIIRLSCKKCQKCECDRPDTCPNGTKLQVIEHENDCCPKHECVCEGCYHGNQTYKPNENWISECINYTCISDGADCYKPQPQHLCLDDEGPEQCPEFAIMNIINYAGGCCKTHECVCKIEKEPECKYPKVVKAVYQTVGELNCTTYECGCPEADKMNRSGCMNTTSSCKADGCTKIETNDCACITSNKCECNPDDCPTEEVVCPDCHNRTTIPAADESYPDRCADNKCCASHQCVPMKCDKSPNITCEKNERKVETKTSTRCCPEYECICEGCLGPNDRVILLGGKWNINSDECNQKICRKEDGKCVWSGVQIPCKPPKIPDCRNETFVKLETKMKNCCSSIECVCKIEKEPECKYPKVVKAVYKTVGELNCTTYECGCPEADKMNRSGCMNTTSSCKADGCTKIETNDCACITSSKCECNPDDCPTEEVVCPDCYNRTTIPAADESYPDRCADNKCCASHQCVPMKCDESDVTCASCQDEIFADVDSCCPKRTCGKMFCEVGNGKKKYVNETWHDENDSCLMKTCTMSSSSDKCPSVIEHDLTSNCTIMTQKCHACQMSVISVENCCEINRCECNTDMARLGSTECSDSCSQLVVDKEASLEGCCTKYKCVQACKENGICRKENETWNRDYQCGSYHKCKCSGSGCDIVKVHPSHCEYYEYPTCVAGGAMMYTDPTKPCCPKVECPCICQTFGDPHYMTFDGSFYTFHGECQYTLVKYRHSKRLHIYSDNYVCGKYDDFDTTCLESVYVKWDDTLIKINMTSGNNIIGSVFVNNHALKSIPWKAGGIEISGMFSAVFLHIKEIDLHLRYTAFGLPAVLVQVPFSEFYNKTVGLCGTCTNLQEDDFELKDTSINPNIQEFGSSWKTDSNESCPQLPPPTCLETNTCPTPCVEDDCDVLLSESFKACHLVVYPERYYNACKYDVQVLGKCSSCSVGAIRSYAEACFEHNVCIKWKTKCPDTCSGDLVFRECVSECEIKKTCQNLDVFGDCTSTKSLSGCFCPSGTVPRTTGSSECVKKDDNCCDMPSSTDVTCVPPLVLNCTDKCGQKQCCCPTKVVCNQNVNCPDGCMTNVTKYDQCNCPLTTECVCNKDLCPKPPVCGDCHELREIVATNSSNKCSSCCPIYQCVHVPCVPDWKKKKVPVGYILVPTASRCCYNLTCDVCFTANDTIIEKGKSKTFKENGCRVEYQCTGDRNFSDSNKCFQLKTNRIDEPCQTAKEYSEKNCKLGQRAVIVDSNDTCCDAYKCECESDTYLQSICSEWNRTAGTCCNLTRVDSDSCCPNYIEECEKEPHQNHCSYIGEIRIMVDKPGFCHKQPECVCTNNSLQLQLECPSYNFKKYSCSDKDCTLVAKTKDPASSNPYTRCCPDYETVCNFTDVVCEDYQIKVERRVCETPKNVCECNSCYSEANDNYYAVGENWSEANNDGSCNFYQCDFNLNERDELGCFKPMPLENQCPQSQECSEYQERQAIPTKDSCCSEYECICKEESKLKALCSKVQSNNDFCNQPGMQNSTYLIKDTSDCCYNTNCSCLTGQELINTCFPLNSFKTLCSYGKSINMLSSSEDCCRYNCSCDMCPPGYNRTKPVAKKCFEVVSLTPQENDRQDCCPKWKLIQKYNTENCPNYTCSNFEKPVLLDSVNENCCREHKCVCDDDSVLATTCPQWHNFTCQTGYERQLVTPQNRTENHCCPEYKCVCKFCVDDDMIILPNHSWRSHNDSCSTSTCTINEATGCPEVTTSKTYNCPPVNVTECLEEGKQVYKNASTNYCCEYCDRVLAPCRPHRKRSILNATIDGIPCRSSDPVDISYCEGGCTTLSSLNEDISKANDQCRCCKPAVSFRRTRKLSCSDGKTRNYKSTEIMTCTCEETKCKLPK